MELKNYKNFKTGIKGLDNTLKGGLPHGQGILVTGEPGSGKTVLMSQFIYQGINKFNQKGVFVTFGEHPDDIVKNVKSFGWDFDKFIKQEKLTFVDLSPSLEMAEEVSTNYNLLPILNQIKQTVKKTGSKRVVIDGIDFLLQKFSNSRAVRQAIYHVYDELKRMGVTCVISREKNASNFENHEFEENFSDGIIELTKECDENKISRFLNITRMRGTDYNLGKVAFKINQNGLEIFQNAFKYNTVKNGSPVRHKFGIEWLDDALGGGIPDGHIVLVSGNTGTGKTTLGLNFAITSAKQKQKCLYVSLIESAEQLCDTALNYDLDFSRFVDNGLIKIIHLPLTEIYLDELLNRILIAVEEGANKIVFDSASALDLIVKDKQKLRYFLLQLAALVKTKRATCIINYQARESFFDKNNQAIQGFIKSDPLGLNAISDGILMLRFLEQKDTIGKILNILKLRGSEHKRELIGYEIDKNGFQLGSIQTNEGNQ